MSKKIFTEQQRFTQWWLWMLILIALAGITLSFVQDYEKSTDYILTMALTYGIVLLVMILFWSLELKTRIDENGIQLKFWPLLIKQKEIKWEDIEKVEIGTYSPLKNYGGWGYRVSLSSGGKAVNVRGNQGIKLHLKSGKTFLIGTQKPDQAKMVISNYQKS